jgi:hypothetical protein
MPNEYGWKVKAMINAKEKTIDARLPLHGGEMN